MNIALYAPFKPLDHPNPSGDWAIGRGLQDYLKNRGHRVWTPSRLRTRWIFWQPWRWAEVLAALRGVDRILRGHPADIWLSYHCYYKAPDILGPWACRQTGMPYVIFQGIYSTKVRRRLTSLPGFFLNRLSLGAADHVFTNRRVDLDNLQRLVPARRLSYVAPGIYPEQFVFDAGARRRLRREWRVGDDPVVIAAAMFRPGVKARGIEWTIRSCGRLWRGGRPLHLVIAGDGIMRDRLTALAAGHLPGRVHFVGRIGRDRMAQIYSAGEVFAFPGFRESLGMVYLEAQSCGLPVVALANGGIPEVVSNGETGLLTPLAIPEAFDRALDRLLADSDLRRRMGAAARQRVRQVHDLNANYRPVLAVLERLASLGSRNRG